MIARPRIKKDFLIRTEDVPLVFTGEAIAKLARDARLPVGVDLVLFGDSVRQAARLYLIEAHRAPYLVRRELTQLYKSLERAINRGESVQNLSPAAKEFLLDRLARRRSLVSLPANEELPSCPLELRSLLIQGGRIKHGRRRRTFEPYLWVPKVGRGRPQDFAAGTLVMWLSSAYLRAKNVPPARTADHRNPGPFARLVQQCLNLLGAKNVNAVQRINDWEKVRRKAEAAQQRRRACARR
jgi:hypothetical protein